MSDNVAGLLALVLLFAFIIVFLIVWKIIGRPFECKWEELLHAYRNAKTWDQKAFIFMLAKLKLGRAGLAAIILATVSGGLYCIAAVFGGQRNLRLILLDLYRFILGLLGRNSTFYVQP